MGDDQIHAQSQCHQKQSPNPVYKTNNNSAKLYVAVMVDTDVYWKVSYNDMI